MKSKKSSQKVHTSNSAKRQTSDDHSANKEGGNKADEDSKDSNQIDSS